MDDEIEILCPNCSELVVSLDCETEEEIREALKAVEQITGWKLHLKVEVAKKDDPCEYRYVFIPVKPEDVIVEGEEILVKEEKIPEMYLNSSYMILVLKHPTENIDPIAIEYTDGYCERKCVLSASQHCYEPHFEPLAKVCKHLGKKFHCHDGGSPELFLEWLEENGYDGVEYEES